MFKRRAGAALLAAASAAPLEPRANQPPLIHPPPKRQSRWPSIGRLEVTRPNKGPY